MRIPQEPNRPTCPQINEIQKTLEWRIKDFDFYDRQDPRGMSTSEYDDYMRAKNIVSSNKKDYNLEQYKQMAERFNKMSFREKIITIQNNKDILTLASDGNWWGVKVKNKEIQEQLYDNEWQFNIENEWGSSEMCILVELLNIDNTDI